MNDDNAPLFADASLPVPAAKISKKKRKKDDDDEARALKHKAKYYCRDPKEWRIVSKYSKDKLETYLSDQEFLSAAKIAEQISSFTQNFYAMVLDKVTKSDGYVEQEIKNDLTLRDAISRELVEYVKHITNRFQIAIFSTVNVINGKRKQQANGSASSQNGQLNSQSEGANVDEFRDGVSPEIVDEDRSEWPEPDAASEFADGGEEKHEDEET